MDLLLSDSDSDSNPAPAPDYELEMLVSAVEAHDLYFVLKRDAAGHLGLSSLQKVIAAMRMLTYRVAADVIDNYVRIGKSISIKSLRRFVKAVVEVFGEEYLRSPNNDDISRLLAQGEARGFPGMLGVSIACIGSGRIFQLHGKVSMKGEAATIHRLFLKLWLHMIFGYDMLSLGYQDLTMISINIMKACIIMHNMIVEDERDVYMHDLNYDVIDENTTVSHERAVELSQFFQNHRCIQDRGIHSQLQADLVEHLWQLQGATMNA
ncbi:hypothetical protein HHK36_015027 [Tetracentron sinense]|uniref:Nuclease HARBI1 n=1 Tax=Tetracentron sinense TaxID=13715 RepID=A0A834Z3Z9_TETSI|nr:hypothetical protein HHK36_015027 [Tetracentron sinense]